MPCRDQQDVNTGSRSSDQSRHDANVAATMSDLLARLCDESLTDDELQRLNQTLAGDASARNYYLRYMAIHSTLITTAGTRARFALDETESRGVSLARSCALGETGSVGLSAVSRSSFRPGGRRLATARWIASVAAAVCVFGAIWWGGHRRGRFADEPKVDIAVAATGAHADATLDSTPGQLVAEVTYLSSSVRWQNPNSSYALASRVRAGQILVLEDGQVELKYASGAELLLTGPSEFLVWPAGGKLRRGELVARVPKAGHGFTIETPHGKVVDLGTEFGVVVDDFGASQVSVFEGKVETLPTGASAASPGKIELTSGRALLWTSDAVIPVKAQGHRYHRPGDDRSPNQPSGSATSRVDEDFRGAAFSPDQWRMIGDVRPSDAGLLLAGSAGAAARPYLISTREFDPSQGAVTVDCELRFTGLTDTANMSFALLTRATEEPSKPGTPWHDMLARCMRCSLKSEGHSGEGILEAGTKYEADRELTNNSWGGFSQPQPDTLYRLEMRDDGLNVSFTVSLAENPSIRKTITCRSLFRGSRNVVALEGFAGGTTIVERLRISQHVSATGESGPRAADGNETEGEIGVDPAVAALLLEELAPHDASLLLADDFDDGELNRRLWKTLGDVVWHNDQVQLGLPNADEHIDTWKARPYLLTKEQFYPAAGTITILGMATFAENFLHGYGGSFAVMTRAADSHGGGPGWENSILRWGVRSNFWPAAFGFDHSLEIHEKPAPNTISLLLSEGFRITPHSRSYLFRVVDDGRSAALTMVDAAHPTVRKTISHSTISTTLSNGHIGFESCWGSPVLLDNVRIYRGNSAKPSPSAD